MFLRAQVCFELLDNGQRSLFSIVSNAMKFVIHLEQVKCSISMLTTQIYRSNVQQQQKNNGSLHKNDSIKQIILNTIE